MSSRSVFAAGPIAAVTGLGHLSRRKAVEAERTHPPIGDFVTIDGVKVHYTRQGSGPTLILIHGAGGNLRDFTFALAGKMAKTNDVIAFDRPGHGYTGVLHHRGESPLEQAQLLHRAAQSLGVTHVALCGYSLGGAVALAWALEEPDFVKGLLLISAVSHPWPGGVGLLFSAAAHSLTSHFVIPPIAAFAPETLVRDTLTSVFRPQDPPKGYLEYIGAGLSLRAHTVRANTRQVARLRPHVTAMSTRYASLKMPVEILLKSCMAPRTGRSMPRCTRTGWPMKFQTPPTPACPASDTPRIITATPRSFPPLPGSIYCTEADKCAYKVKF